MEWISAQPNGKEITKWHFVKPHGRHPGRRTDHTTACSPPLLPSKWLYYTTYIKCISTWQDTTTEVMIEHIHHSRICSGNKYQSNCTTYKTHAMTTHHGGTGHTDEDRDLNSHVEDTRGIDICANNDNESTNSLDTMLTFGGSEVDGHLSDLLSSSQVNFTIHTREINSLWQ